MRIVYKSIWHRLWDYTLTAGFVIAILAGIAYCALNNYAHYKYHRELYEAAQKINNSAAK
jgi:hypothetical protein